VTRVLVVNAGSSSLKVSVLEPGSVTPLATTKQGWGSDATRVADRAVALRAALEDLAAAGVQAASLDVAAHRVVHGGARFREATSATEWVIAELEQLSELAPLHNAIALETLRAQRELLPDVRAVCVFDTAFHATLPREAYVYPLPWEWHERWGVRRFGFHGLSVAWSVRRAAELLGRPAEDLALLVAHLGSGCSVTAVLRGRSVSTSMGLTPLEGLAMGTRSGSVDPGVLLHALRERGLSPDELADVLDHGSGLLGMSGLSGDVRELLAASDSARARLALDVFARRASEGIAAAAASLERVDGLVFTGGIGENSGALRAAITSRLAVLGIPAVDDIDVERDGVLDSSATGIAVLRIEAREDVVMAEAAAEAVAARAAGSSPE
jgi:acetate kinase